MSDGQKLGAVTVLAVAIIVYATALFNVRKVSHGLYIDMGDQRAGSFVLEIHGGDEDGIYFLPEGTTVKNIRNVPAVPDTIENMVAAKNNCCGIDALKVVYGGKDIHWEDVTAANRLALGLPVDLNTASEADLVLVPGIGKKIAARIIQFRMEQGRFEKLSDLLGIPGIKEKKFEALRRYLTLQLPP